ncbi:STAS domain-containing protein [Planobispora siamensis]|uniref:Anti-sigma factor antagonist n=1 Tax=Planobispora siamensis TaxID=936338 RepID=A0A8J3WKL9_9ACTN|nr:STAS domain-containing protein [Planobispora siamensis]GIH94294.1 anti-sigma factor antagonist [Planobispora siamensis]
MQHEHGLTVTLRPHSANLHMVLVAGDLDHHTASRLRAALDEIALAPGTGVVIDLSAMTFCDSTGISILVAAHRRAHEAGAALALAGMERDIVYVFQIMGLDRLFSLYDTPEEAVAALRDHREG